MKKMRRADGSRNIKLAKTLTKAIIAVIICFVLGFIPAMNVSGTLNGKDNSGVVFAKNERHLDTANLGGRNTMPKDKDANGQNLEDEHRFPRRTISVGGSSIMAVRTDGTVMIDGYALDLTDGADEVGGWEDIVSVACNLFLLGLQSDGTVECLSYGDETFKDICEWEDIVDIAAGGYTGEFAVGLKSDGTLVMAGNDYNYGQYDVEEWTDIISISAGGQHTAGLKADGTVLVAGDIKYDDMYVKDKIKIEEWKDIVAIDSGVWQVVGLKSDGTVVAFGPNYDGRCDVEEWTDIVAVCAGEYNTVGLRADGTVLVAGGQYFKQEDVDDWKDIVAISCDHAHIVGLKSDGTVVAAGESFPEFDPKHESGLENWCDIRLPDDNRAEEIK